MLCGERDTIVSFVPSTMNLTVKVIKIGRMGRPFRMQELDPCRKLTVLKRDGTLRVVKRRLMWLGSVEENVKNIGVRNWRCNSLDREDWRTVLDKAKVYQ